MSATIIPFPSRRRAPEGNFVARLDRLAALARAGAFGGAVPVKPTLSERAAQALVAVEKSRGQWPPPGGRT